MIHQNFILVVMLLIISISGIAVSKKLFKIPYPISLVIIGLIIGLLRLPYLSNLREFISQKDIFGFIIISIFLPTLLGEASLKLSYSHIKDNLKPILLLAIPGTLITFVVVGLSSNLILGLSVQIAFTFAALMSATDPLSVLSIFKSMNVSHKLSMVVEGESLLNDGVAVVLFNIAVFKFLFYTDIGIVGIFYAVSDFLYIFGGGTIIGLIFGIAFSFICKLFDDSPLEIAFSVIMFYGVFIISEHFHFSGIISVVISGIVLGNYGSKIGMSPTTHVNINSFWETMAFFANSIVFLMVGLEIATTNFQEKWMIIILSIFIVLIGRAIAVYLSTISLKKMPLAYKHVINWGGIKGSLSIALALSLPMNFQGREEILILTFSVVLFSLIFQGLTIKPLLKFLKINNLKNNHRTYENILLKYFKVKYALASLSKSKEEGLLIEHDAEDEIKEYKQNLIQVFSELKDMENKYPELKKERIDKAKVKILYSQYKALSDMSVLDLLSEEVADEEKKKILDSIEKHLFE